MSLQDSRQLENVKVLLKVGADGRGIAEIVKVGTSGVIDTYDIVLSDGTRFPFDVTNGSSIATIEKTATVGLVDTYTITLTNGDTFEFEVTNADGSTAGTVNYDNTSSGLDATNVQDAIDEVNAKADTKTDQSLIATVQPNLTAVKAYAKGEQFVYNGLLYKTTAAISSGGTITIGGNCELSPSVTNQISNLIKKKSYNFTSFSENCMVTDLSIYTNVILGLKCKNRYGWNLIARSGVGGSVSPDVWVITTSSDSTLSGRFEIDVYYMES